MGKYFQKTQPFEGQMYDRPYVLIFFTFYEETKALTLFFKRVAIQKRHIF